MLPQAHCQANPLLIGCGILRKEIAWLNRKNGWGLETEFLESSLHIDLGALQAKLSAQLQRHRERQPLVFYGCCHPRMDDLLEQAQTRRTQGQNCIDMLLGHERFMAELEAGAFFLLEDWACNWEAAILRTFGPDRAVTRAIFHEDRKYLLAIRTPLSADYAEDAEVAARSVDLPLHWMNCNLDHLEQVLLLALQGQQQ